MLSGMIAGGMTAITPEQWVDQNIVSKLKSTSPKTNTDPNAAAKIHKIPPTDQQYGIVGEPLDQPLAVVVTDSKGVPVQGASVTFKVIAGGGKINGADSFTTTTDYKGIAKGPLTLGTKTGDNPDYRKLNTTDEFVTQIGVNLVTASVPSKSISISQPFEAYGKPDAPKEIVKVLGNGNMGMVNTSGGSLVAKIVDQYGNPISNLNLIFKTIKTESRYPDIALPSGHRTAQFYKSSECGKPYPIFGECSTSAELTVKTKYFGVIADTILGNTVGTKYIVEARNIETDILPALFELYTGGFRNKDDYIPPGIYIKYQSIVNDEGEPVNASKAGTELKAPLVSELVMLYDDYVLDGPHACGDTNCWTLIPGGTVNIKPITDGTVTYTPIQGEGTVTPTENLLNGKYQTRYTTGLTPMENRIEALGTATITAPEVRLNPFVTNCSGGPMAMPSFSGEPNANYKPECKTAITEYVESSLQCSGGTCSLPTKTVSLKSGQQAVFYHQDPVTGELLTVTGEEQKAEYIVYGVLPEVKDTDHSVIILDKEGHLIQDTSIRYSIKPPEYNAVIAAVDIYERPAGSTSPDDDTLFDWLPGDATQGEGTATIFRGMQFDGTKEYYAQVVLNNGSDVEVRGEKYPLPIAQFRIVSDEDGVTAMEGVVTDGAARLRLQLIAKNNHAAFSGLVWQLIDPEILDYTRPEIRGTLMDGENAVETLPVVFNSDGIAKAVYRAPETFVRWETLQESGDKERPERLMQPMINHINDFTGQINPIPTIRLKRPPVVLVHGLWGDPKVWDEFVPQFNDRELYKIGRADYKTSNAGYFHENAQAIDSAITAMFDAQIYDQFAVAKVDIIGHSMGGLITREYCRQQALISSDCTQKIRRFITIDSPHGGSELANLVVNINQNPHAYSLSCPAVLPIVHATGNRIWSDVNNKIIAGGLIDLSINSIAIQNLETTTTNLSWDAVVGETAIQGDVPDLRKRFANSWDIELLWKMMYWGCQLVPDDSFFEWFGILDTVFSDPNDRIVSVSSQSRHSNTAQQFRGVDHFTVRNDTDVIKSIKNILEK